MAVDHDSAGTSARPDFQTTTIPLATDADFLKAEAELVRLLADADETLKTTPDDKWPEVQARWWAYHEALLTAEPRTPLQAAIVLRRVLCQHCGLPSGSNDMNLPAITRVAGFLASPAAASGASTETTPDLHTGFHAVLDMEAPIRDIRAVGETLYALSTCRAFPEPDGMRLVCDMLSTQVIDKTEAIKAQFDKAITSLRSQQGEPERTPTA